MLNNIKSCCYLNQATSSRSSTKHIKTTSPVNRWKLVTKRCNNPCTYQNLPYLPFNFSVRYTLSVLLFETRPNCRQNFRRFVAASSEVAARIEFRTSFEPSDAYLSAVSPQPKQNIHQGVLSSKRVCVKEFLTSAGASLCLKPRVEFRWPTFCASNWPQKGRPSDPVKF